METVPGPDAALASTVAKLWPNREHESGVKGIVCRFGLHRWRRLDLHTLVPGKDIAFCFWCSRVRIDGKVYEP